MRILSLVLAALVMLFGSVTRAADTAPADAKKINVIVLTGTDVAVHPWKDNSVFINELLEGAGKFTVRVDEDCKILDAKDELAKFDVVMLLGSFQGKKWALSDGAKANLLDFVKEGKGFYAQHYATASWADWAEFGKLCGKRWINGKSGHTARSVFDVKIADTDHPITKGLKDFSTNDELYSKLQGDADDIHAVATGESEFSKKTEPLVFTHAYGKGHVVINSLGHDRDAMKPAEVKELIMRSLEWAATGKVAEAAK